ncbi:P-type conjugative transfer protein TrbL [Allosphingosinicella vermicomposti]|uniref:P-type conjugative transfer protein TrbL n=1 Tax=Allosphingosinicella vermicomposti TaxID=614671 RepID=UPI000D0EF45A|nr:P-type conjugative transfer protein TrbL [Allosphingosinicella vermicomposti]
MGDLNVIDRFMDTFIRYIDSGFGLLGGDVAFLTTVLIGIDITLAGLFWAMEGGDNVLGKFIKKILYVGTFAFILGSFSSLSEIVFRSFAGLGLTAGGGAVSADDLLKPGKLAGTGFEAAWPLLEQVSELLGFTSFFDNFLTIVVLLVAWLVVIVAFFVLSVQLFITIIEFKLTSLAGFVLVPFALWNRTSFLAERVLGNVVASGIKVMVMAVIVGIGSGFFGEFVGALKGQEPDIGQAMSLVLASMALFGLGIFGPGIASGLVAGAPQLGAGAAVGTVGAIAGGAALGAGAAISGARALGSGGLAAIRSGTAVGASAAASYSLGKETSGATGAAGVGAGLKAVAANAASVAGRGLGLGAAAEAGREAAWSGSPAQGGAGVSSDAAPEWARRLRTEQTNRQRRHAAVQAIREGDRPSAPANPDIKERED